MSTVLFSAMRNEAPFLLDWISYHLSIGFDRIIIVTNDCTDASYPLLEKLSSKGIVEHYDQKVSPGMSAQGSAVNLINGLDLIKAGDWGVFLDADEYLNIKVGNGMVFDLVGYLEAKSAQGMLINWRLFGDSGQTSFTGSYVSEDYVSCEAPPKKSQFKAFFKMGAVAVGFSPLLHRCLLAPKAGNMTDFLTGSGDVLGCHGDEKAIRHHKKWLEQGDNEYAHLMGDEIGYDVAQINHYIVRDPKSFMLKKSRGRGFQVNQTTNDRHTDDFYNSHNKNEMQDRSIVRWAEKVAAKKKLIVQQGGVSQEVRNIENEYQAVTIKGPNVISENVDQSGNFPLTFPSNVSEFVQDKYAKADGILEYGSGGSTLLAAKLGKRCLSVESDKDWAANLNSHLAQTYGETCPAEAKWIDIGPTKDWGYPSNKSKFEQYWRYPLQVWSEINAQDIDTVLIDGRMRKACFAATLMNAKRDLCILFDDYTDRRSYHDVERFVKPKQFVGRMAEFQIEPDMISMSDVPGIIPWFSNLR